MLKVVVTPTKSARPNYWKNDLVTDEEESAVVMVLKTASTKSKTFRGIILSDLYDSNIGWIDYFDKCVYPYKFKGKIELSNDEEDSF